MRRRICLRFFDPKHKQALTFDSHTSGLQFLRVWNQFIQVLYLEQQFGLVLRMPLPPTGIGWNAILLYRRSPHLSLVAYRIPQLQHQCGLVREGISSILRVIPVVLILLLLSAGKLTALPLPLLFFPITRCLSFPCQFLPSCTHQTSSILSSRTKRKGGQILCLAL